MSLAIFLTGGHNAVARLHRLTMGMMSTNVDDLEALSPIHADEELAGSLWQHNAARFVAYVWVAMFYIRTQS